MSGASSRGRGAESRRRNVKRSRSNTLLVALSLIGALVLTACEFRIHANLVIEEDESGTLEVELSMDQELAGLAGGGFGGELAIGEDLVPAGWTAEVISGGEYEGIRASADFESLDQLRQRLDDLAGETGTTGAPLPGFLSDISPTREDDTFLFHLVIPEEAEGLIGEGLEESPIPLDLGMLDEVFDIRLTLVLPGEIVTTNADVVTGQTLVWNLSLADTGRVLEAESKLPGSGPGMIIVWAAVALALVVVIYIVVKIRGRRRAAARDPSEGRPPASIA